MKDKLRLYIEENLSINTFKRSRFAKMVKKGDINRT